MIEDKDIQKYLSIIEKSKPDEGKVTTEGVITESRSENNYQIDPSSDIRGIQKMRIGNGVTIQKDCWLNIAFDNPQTQYLIEIGDGTNIGRRCTISAANKIVIGKNVLLGPGVFIADTSHEYRHVAIPIIKQGITTSEDEIHIGDETWIGTNSVLVGNIRIGKHCVIGANTFINQDIPDYCVAVGNPLRIVKVFDLESGRWVKTADQPEINKYLSMREGDLLHYLVPITDLKSMQVEVSSTCNLQCRQCFQYIEGHKMGFFTRELWDKRINPVLGQLSDIHLVGIGEPLLCQDFFYFVEESKKHNINVHTISNLQLVNKDVAEKLVLSGLNELSFSCDGISQETYEKIKVNGKFEKLKSTLDMINKFKLQYNSLFPRLILNFGAMKSNIHELPQVVEFAKKYHVHLIIAYHNVIYLPDLKDESLYHYQQLSDQKFGLARQQAEKLGIPMLFPGLFSQPIKQKDNKIYCNYPNRHLYIYSDGRVGPCCMDFPDRYILGDINTSTIEEIWNSLLILRLRSEVTNCPSDTCRYCVNHMKMDVGDPKYLFRFKGSNDYVKRITSETHGFHTTKSS